MRTTLNALANEMERDLASQGFTLANEMNRQAGVLSDMVRKLGRIPVRYNNGHITIDEMYQEFQATLGEISLELTVSNTGTIKDQFDKEDMDLGKLKTFIATL